MVFSVRSCTYARPPSSLDGCLGAVDGRGVRFEALVRWLDVDGPDVGFSAKETVDEEVLDDDETKRDDLLVQGEL